MQEAMPPRRVNAATGTPGDVNAQMAKAMSDMAAAVAAQTVAKIQRDQLKQQREDKAADSRGLADFRRHNPPQFHGDVDPEKADLWLQEVEKILNVINCPEDSMVKYVTYLLLGDAEYWWKNAKSMSENAQEEITWEVFQAKFLERYFPQSARTKLDDDFLKLRQGNMTVGAYAARFETLSRYFKFFRQTVDEAYMCHRFQEGLKDEIQDMVVPLGIQQFQPLVEKCKEIEAMKNKRLNRRNNNTGGPIRANHSNSGQGGQGKKPYQRPQRSTGEQYRPMTATPGSKGDSSTTKPYCFRCGDPGHYANNCTAMGDLCYNCRQTGHLARDCKAPKAGAANHSYNVTRQTAPGRVYSMDGQGATHLNESFQGECEIAGTILPVLFDTGATHSFISMDYVERLKLSASPLPFDLMVTTAAHKIVTADTACMLCPVTILNKKFLVNLICLPLKNLAVILGMD